jgi:hypothetical protein
MPALQIQCGPLLSDGKLVKFTDRGARHPAGGGCRAALRSPPFPQRIAGAQNRLRCPRWRASEERPGCRELCCGALMSARGGHDCG